MLFFRLSLLRAIIAATLRDAAEDISTLILSHLFHKFIADVIFKYVAAISSFRFDTRARGCW